MKKDKNKKLRLIISIVVTLILTAIAWTNELVDWLIKLNINVVNPNQIFLATALFAIIGAGWVLYEIVD